MNINNTNGTSLAELKNTAMSFDRASCKDVFIGDDKKKSENYVAIYNENKQDVCAIASTDYKIVQHQDFVNSVADSLINLNINTKVTKVMNGGDVIFVDISFTDSKLYVQKGEEFVCGLRLVNSYNKTTGIMVLPQLVRLVCSNGMVVDVGNKWVNSFNVKHTSNLVESFTEATQVMIKRMIDGNDKLKAMVNDCIADSMEWIWLNKLVLALVKTQKHTENILKLLSEAKAERFSRWTLYCAFTNYATHCLDLSPLVNQRLQGVAQNILVTPLSELKTTIPEDKSSSV